MNRKIILSFIPLFIGGFLYVPFRTGNIIFLKYFHYFYQGSFIRKSDWEIVPDWIIYSLPDALWILSFTYLMLSIWDFQISRENIFWIIIAPIIGIGSEIGQTTDFIGGTFDYMDLLLMLLAAGIPFTHLLLNQRKIHYVKN